jgi:hypothetical protein
MPPINKPSRVPTPEQVRAEQKAQAERLTAEKQAAQAAAQAKALAKIEEPAVPAVVDTRDFRQAYLDTIAPTTIAGKLVKFSKAGEFVISETDEVIDPERDFVALCDETLIGGSNSTSMPRRIAIRVCCTMAM